MPRRSFFKISEVLIHGIDEQAQGAGDAIARAVDEAIEIISARRLPALERSVNLRLYIGGDGSQVKFATDGVRAAGIDGELTIAIPEQKIVQRRKTFGGGIGKSIHICIARRDIAFDRVRISGELV